MSMRSARRLSTVSTDSVRLAITVGEVRRRLERDLARKCSPHDAHRILKEEWWVSTFLLCYNCDVDVTVAVIMECLKWRLQYQVEHIGMLCVKDLLDRKAMYMHGRDVEGNGILWCAMREHTSGDVGFQRLFVFWMERHFNETHAAPMTIFIDMTSTSFVNLDYDLFKFILHALKYYYPNCALDMVVYECPSRLAASWKVIKSWLDAGHPMVHLLGRESISQFIPLCNLPVHLGGEDHFIFTMDDIARSIPSREPILEEVFYEQTEASSPMESFPSKRSVKFESEEEEVVTRTVPLTLSLPPSLPPPRSRSASKTRRAQLPPALRDIAEGRVHAPAIEWAATHFLSICPRDELRLAPLPNNSSTDFVDVVALRNTGDRRVIYKIKTTSPEKFRVRPSNGEVSSGATEIVRVSLQQEYKATAVKDKFLLMAVCSDSAPADQLPQVWSSAPEEDKMEVRLRCRVMEDMTMNGMTSSVISTNGEEDNLRQHIHILTNNQRMLTIFVAFLLFLQFVCILNERSNNASLRLAIQTLSAATRKNQDSQP